MTIAPLGTPAAAPAMTMTMTMTMTGAITTGPSEAVPDLAAGLEPVLAPLRVSLEQGRSLLSRVLQGGGLALILSAGALWVMPGSQVDVTLLTMKLAVSLLALFSGVALWSANQTRTRPDVRFDPIRRDLRVLQRDRNGDSTTVLRRSYDSLGSARFTADTLELRDLGGTVVMRLRIDSA